MVAHKHSFFNKIIVILSILLLLTSFLMSPIVEAASVKTQMEDGEYYYSGTTKGAYKVSESVFKWLLSTIGEIVDFLLGLFTMGGRMVFVGWAALLEEFITWSLEATVGVPIDIENDVNATQVDGAIKSSNNVTIEAIVYNQIPILDINLFENTVPTCVSGTGNFVVECETCYNTQLAQEGRTPPNNSREKKICRMEECTCQTCYKFLVKEGYLQGDASGNPVFDADGKPVRVSNAVTVIKDSVSKWYYVIRLLAIAAMLVVAIVAGIKGVISSAASEKALYKRVLVDWVVGMILLFSIHYFMVFIIHMNEILVDFIRDTETGVTEILKKELYYGTSESNQELEISIYQAVRTRAYDPKLINGTTGTILYITLVFYTIRFLFTYLKRYFTIIVLTIMAPGVAFGVALQKVLTGKSKAFTDWLSDYFINVIIQTIHALIYTIFVSEALIISLNSVTGMIIAFVFINFMLKADDIFRKIFKLSSASTDDAMNAWDSVKKMKDSAKSAAQFMTAGNILKNSPVTKAVMSPIKMAGAGAVVGLSRANTIFRNRGNAARTSSRNISQSGSSTNTGSRTSSTSNSNENSEERRQRALSEVSKKLQQLRQEIDPSGKPRKEFQSFLYFHNPKHGIGFDGEDAMEKELLDLEKLAEVREIPEETRDELQQVRVKLDNATNITTGDVIRAHIDKALDEKNYFEYDERTGKRKLIYGFRKRKAYDHVQHKWVTHSLGELIAEQMKSENLLGFTEEDKKLFKEVTGFAKGTLLGMGSLFVGLGTVVSNPAVGFGLLANGTLSAIEFIDKTGMGSSDRTYRPPIVDEKNKRFTFKRFGKGAKQRIVKSIKANAQKEQDRVVVENVRKNHKTLYRTLRLGGAGLVVAGAIGLGTVAAAPVVLGAGVTARVVGKGVKRYSGYTQNSLIGKLNKHHYKQLKKLREDLVKDEIEELSRDEAEEMQKKYIELVSLLEHNIDQSQESSAQEDVEEHGKAKDAGDVLELDNGETIQLSTIPKNLGAGVIQTKAARTMIDEAVSKVLIDEVLRTGSDLSLNPKKINTETRKILEKRLKAYGILEDKTLDQKIANLDSEIDESARIILEKELGINSEELGFVRRNPTEDSTEATQETTDIQGEVATSTGETTEEMSAFERVLVSEVIKEKVKTQEVKELSDLTVGTIVDAVREKKREIATRQSTGDVVRRMQEARATGQTSQSLATPQPQQSFAQLAEIRPDRIEAIESGVRRIKKDSRRRISNTPEARREEKKRAVMALTDVLMGAATNGTQIQSKKNPQQRSEKTADEMIQELFDRKEDQRKVYSLLENIDSMKRLNKRGENAKMKTRNLQYHQSKAFESRVPISPARQATNDGSQSVRVTGDRAVKPMKEKTVHAKEVYGPVVDIVDLIRGMSNQERR